jgi:hypothetical protein
MRLIWSGFLMAGLLLTGYSVYERRELRDESRQDETGLVATSEDGLPMPSPNGTPKPYMQR